MTAELKPENRSDAQPAALPAAELRDDRTSVIALLKSIQSGKLNPRTLASEDRRLCVGHLVGEGYSNPEVAEILQVSERTVIRDRRAVEEANAIGRDPALLARMVGRLVTEAELVIHHVRRISRDKNVNASARIEAERACWQVVRDLVVTLQGLGYLPTAVQTVKADLTHHLGEGMTIEAVTAEMERIRTIQQECSPGDPVMASLLEKTSGIVTKLVLAGPAQPAPAATELEGPSHDAQSNNP